MAKTFNVAGAVYNLMSGPSIDAKYGPYESLEEAFDILGPDGDDIACIGLTIGIQPTPEDPITEYWFKDACDEVTDLVLKKSDLTGYVEDPDYVHTDNNYTNAEKGKLTNLENYDDTEIRASLDDKVDKISGKGLSANDYTNADKAIVDGVTDALADKVDKVGGKGLSTNDYTTNEKNKLAQLENYDDTEIRTSLSNKVDKISGKGLSTEDYTTAEKTKLSGLENYDDTEVRGLIADKVDKVSGKGLSTEDYTTTEKTKLSGIEDSADVNIIETIKVNGTALTPDANKAVDITIGAAAEYTIAEVTTTAGYAKSYQLKKDNVAVGATIDIPKDLVVSAGEVKTVTTPDVPYEGAEVGDKYIDLTLNDPNANHIYIPVDSLVSAYTAGNGIDISNANVISTKIDSANANGLSVGANGLALAAATTTDAGAMSASDKTKLEGIAANADVNVIEKIKVNSVEQTVTNKTVDIAVPTATSDLTNDSNFVVDANYVHTDNNYSTAEKTKLTNIESGAQENVIESITVNGVAATISNKNASVTVSTGGGLIDSISVNGVTQTIDAQKNVDITVPTETSDLTNDSGFITKEVGNLTNYTKTSDLATVATTGSYNDLNNKPTLFSGSYNDLTDKPELFSGDYNDLTNKPTLFSGNYNDLTNKPTIPSALSDLSDDVTHRVVTDTEKATWNSKIDEPALEGTAGQVLTTDGNGGRTWTTIQGGGSGGSGSGDNSIWTDAVSCAVGATSCTITNAAITTTCTIAEYCQNASETQIGIKTRTITNGSMVLTFDALEEATEFKLHIWPTTISYIVTFDTHSGSNIDSQRVYSGNLVTRPVDPSKANYVFAGWYTSDQYTTPFNFNTPISANTTIHAKWEAPSTTYTVEFNSHGGSSVSTQTVNAGSVAIEPADPTKSGYTFEGWYTSDTYTTEYDFSIPVNSNLVLHAKWEEELPTTYTVTFNTDGGSSVDSQTVEAGGHATRPATNPTKIDNVFDNWYTDNTYATLFDFANTVINDNTTIYAKWIPQYTVSFNSHGGSSVSDQIVTAGSTATRPSNPTRSGYIFDDWYTTSSYTTKFDFSTAINANTELHANWIPQYTVRFYDGSTVIDTEMVTANDTATRPTPDPVKSGYVFDNWYSDTGYQTPFNFTDAITMDTNIYGRWLAAHTVTFNSEGGSAVASQTIIDGETATRPINPTKTDYDFVGWYTEDTYVNQYDFSTPVTADITLYAKWVEHVEYLWLTNGPDFNKKIKKLYNSSATEYTDDNNIKTITFTKTDTLPSGGIDVGANETGNVIATKSGGDVTI